MKGSWAYQLSPLSTVRSPAGLSAVLRIYRLPAGRVSVQIPHFSMSAPPNLLSAHLVSNSSEFPKAGYYVGQRFSCGGITPGIFSPRSGVFDLVIASEVVVRPLHLHQFVPGA